MTNLKFIYIFLVVVLRSIVFCDAFISELPQPQPSEHEDEIACYHALIFVSLYVTILSLLDLDWLDIDLEDYN